MRVWPQRRRAGTVRLLYLRRQRLRGHAERRICVRQDGLCAAEQRRSCRRRWMRCSITAAASRESSGRGSRPSASIPTAPNCPKSPTFSEHLLRNKKAREARCFPGLFVATRRLCGRLQAQALVNRIGSDFKPPTKLVWTNFGSPASSTDLRRGISSSNRMRISSFARYCPRQRCAP